MAEFQDKLARLQKALTATTQTATEAGTRLDAIRRAIDATPSLPRQTARRDAASCRSTLGEINIALNGDRIWRSHNEGTPASISEHVQDAASPTRGTTGTADQDRDGAVSDRIRRPGSGDPEAAQAGGDRYQGAGKAARRRRRPAHSRPPARLEKVRRRKPRPAPIVTPAPAPASASVGRVAEPPKPLDRGRAGADRLLSDRRHL